MIHDEPDTCRICSAPGEPDAPLFHPCKCSGTIRYIHQDCLTTWLAHSKKKTCDVCKYQYSFTKVYSDNMPKKIPFILFLRKFAQQLFWTCVLGLRALMVTTIWLAFLPYVTVWTWRFYFVLGDNIAWWINDRPRPSQSLTFLPYLANITVSEEQNGTETSNRTFVGLVTSYPAWRALSSDIFTGQIIASLIVLVFLGVFLLREWILQNARPGVFEDDDLGGGAEAHEVAPEADQPVPPEEQAEQPAAPEHPSVDATSADGFDGAIPGDFQQSTSVATLSSLTNGSSKPGPSILSSSTSIASNASSDAPEELDAPEHDAHGPPRHRRRLVTAKDPRHERNAGTRVSRVRSRTRISERSSPGSPQSSPLSKSKRKAWSSVDLDVQRKREAHREPSPSPFSEGIGGSSSDFEFTFSVGGSPSPSGSTTSASVAQTSSSAFSFAAPPTNDELFSYKASALPYPLTPRSASPEASGSSSGLRRPPLPTATLSTSEERSDSTGLVDDTITSALMSPSLPLKSTVLLQQPLASPSLATYRAPEELGPEAGPSRSNQAVRSDYFDDNSEKDSLLSSTGATATNSMFKEELDDEFFRDFSGDSEEDGEWDDLADIEPDRPEVVERFIHREVVQAPPAPAAVADEAPNRDPAEDADAINDDDVDGALEEAIGMRGPLTTVFQNAALMIFVLDTTIGLGVFLPFTIGKTSALLSLEPRRILQILHLPIQTIRYITDPLVDTCFFLARQFAFPVFRAVFRVTSLVISPFISSVTTSGVEQVGNNSFPSSKLKTLLNDVSFIQEAYRRLSLADSQGQESAIVRGISHLSTSPVGQFLEPYLARLGRHVRLNATALKAAWIDLANGDANANKLFAIAVGYTIVGVFVALYLNILNVGSVQSAGRAIRNAIRQQLIVLKVAVFIVIELAIFPLGCGLMLDLCTLQLFPNTTLRSRMAFFAYAPVTATFYHWMIGTMFMYQFAILLSGCRKIMRPGAMWFIKDPQDQNFHPIRDILDRPTLVQMRKLAISAVMYSIVVALGMGGLIVCLRIWGRTLLPLRWKLREPLSEVPVDLLFLHIVMPSTIRYFRPRRLVRAVATKYWQWAARQLRLTSYMFGDRHPNEMCPSATFWTWMFNLISRPTDKGKSSTEKSDFDGGYRRVPAQDNISLPRDIRATVAVDEHGNALDEAGGRLIGTQTYEAEKARRDVLEDYTVVYLPPRFRERVIIFIISLWLCGSMLFVASLAVPIHIGRAVFSLILQREVHDGYSIVIGFYLLWGCYLFGRTLDRIDKRRQRTGGDEPRGEWAVYIFKRSVLWIGKFAWMAFWLGFVIPTLLALVMEFYLVHPLRLIVDPDLTLKIRIVDSWALGLLYTKMALSTRRFRPETGIDAAIKEIKEGGWRRLDAVAATLDIILPVTGGLLAMLLLPILVILGLQYLLPMAISSKSLFLYVYPGIFMLAAFARVFSGLQALGGYWAQQIRDSEFLVELRLRNLEQTANKVPKPNPAPVLVSVSVSQTTNITAND